MEHNNSDYSVRIQTLRARIIETTNTTDIATPIVDPGFSVVVEKCMDKDNLGEPCGKTVNPNANDGDLWKPLLSDADCKATIQTAGAVIGGTADQTYRAIVDDNANTTGRRAEFKDLVIRSTVTQNDMEQSTTPTETHFHQNVSRARPDECLPSA